MTIRRPLCALAALLAFGCAQPEDSTPARFDVLLRGGTVIDGTGAEPRQADVGLLGDRIAAVGELQGATAELELDVTGLIVTPGFIDTHSHADEGLVRPELAENRGFLTQGVTTSIFGVDGYWSPQERAMAEEFFVGRGVGTNWGYYIGHNGVRRTVVGMENRAPTDDEMAQMKTLVREAMGDGALGLSTGLMYLPGNHATTDEVVELAKVAAEYGGVYDSHIRDPGKDLVASVAEALEIGRRAGLHAHPAHHKAPGRDNFGKADEISELIANAREAGEDVTVDQYPYDGAATLLLVELFATDDQELGEQLQKLSRTARDPALTADEQQAALDTMADLWREVLADPQKRRAVRAFTENPPDEVYTWVDAVGYQGFRVVVSDAHPEWIGRMVVELAKEHNQLPFDLIAQLIEDDGAVAKITLGACLEDDVQYILTRPWTMVASDGAITGFEGGGGHPRSRGTFPRVLGHYARDLGLLSLEEAVHKMTGLPAAYLGWEDRGVLREGAAADVTVFDPATVIDRATWREPALYSEGIVHVFVNGVAALRDGTVTGELAGRYLPRSGSQTGTESETDGGPESGSGGETGG